MIIQDCLIKIGYKSTVWDNKYEGIKPHELETRPIPSLAELEAVWPQIEAERIAAEQAEVARRTAKAQAFIDNLPSMEVITAAINNAFPDPKQNAFIKKLARVVYILAKNSET